MRAFVRYDNQGIIVPTSFVMKKTMPKVGQWKEISTSKSVSGFPAQSSQKNLRAFVRYNGKNKVVPGSVVVRGQVPSGNFSEVTYDLARPISAGYVFLTKAELETAYILVKRCCTIKHTPHSIYIAHIPITYWLVESISS